MSAGSTKKSDEPSAESLAEMPEVTTHSDSGVCRDAATIHTVARGPHPHRRRRARALRQRRGGERRAACTDRGRPGKSSRHHAGEAGKPRRCPLAFASVRSLPAFGDVFEVRVTLRHVDPPISRTLRVPADLPLSGLHEVLQTAFGWQNSHLHDFHVGDIRFGMPTWRKNSFRSTSGPHGSCAVARAKLGSCIATTSGTTGSTTSWSSALIRTATRASVVSEARACPPEDCGGPPGYAHMLDVLSNPDGEEHEEMKEWAPRRLDPKKFDLGAVNKKLVTLSKRLQRRK